MAKPTAAFKRFATHPAGVWGLAYLGLVTLVALGGYILLPDDSPGANRQLLEVARRPPGTAVTTLRLASAVPPAPTSWLQGWLAGWPSPYSTWVLSDSLPITFSRDSVHYRLLGGLEETLALPPVLLPLTYQNGKALYQVKDSLVYYPTATGQLLQVTISSLRKDFLDRHLVRLQFPLGTDAFGRDVMSRLMLGSRVSLGIGALAVTLSLLVGVSLGAVAGYFGGWVDAAVQWCMAVVWALPSLLLALAIAFALGRGVAQLFLAVGLSTWVETARVVRGEVSSLRTRPYVAAAWVIGLPHHLILLRHILPNLLGPIILLAVANFATAVLLEAGLSFLGLGVRPPTPSWGGMLFEGYSNLLTTGGKWLAFLPGLALVLLVLALNFIGQALQEALNPRRSV